MLLLNTCRSELTEQSCYCNSGHPACSMLPAQMSRLRAKPPCCLSKYCSCALVSSQIVGYGALPILIQMLCSEDQGVHYEAVGALGNLVHSSHHIKRKVTYLCVCVCVCVCARVRVRTRARTCAQGRMHACMKASMCVRLQGKVPFSSA